MQFKVLIQIVFLSALLNACVHKKSFLSQFTSNKNNTAVLAPATNSKVNSNPDANPEANLNSKPDANTEVKSKTNTKDNAESNSKIESEKRYLDWDLSMFNNINIKLIKS